MIETAFRTLIGALIGTLLLMIISMMMSLISPIVPDRYEWWIAILAIGQVVAWTIAGFISGWNHRNNW